MTQVRSMVKTVTFRLIGHRYASNHICKFQLCPKSPQRMKKIPYKYEPCSKVNVKARLNKVAERQYCTSIM